MNAKGTPISSDEGMKLTMKIRLRQENATFDHLEAKNRSSNGYEWSAMRSDNLKLIRRKTRKIPSVWFLMQITG